MQFRSLAYNSCIGALRQPGGQPKPKNLTMPNQQTPAPMSKEEILKKHGIYPGFRSTYTYEAILSAMDEYRLAFEKEQHQPSDPYWSDPATWPEWANWRAVGEDGCVYFSSILMEANTLYGSWSTSIYAASKMVPRAVTHNPNWRNSLRSREEVSGGK